MFIYYNDLIFDAHLHLWGFSRNVQQNDYILYFASASPERGEESKVVRGRRHGFLSSSSSMISLRYSLSLGRTLPAFNYNRDLDYRFCETFPRTRVKSDKAASGWYLRYDDDW